MRISFEIGHPGHVHHFHILAKKLIQKGHKVIFFTKKKEVTIELLENFQLPYEIIGTTQRSLYRKVVDLVFVTIRLFAKCVSFKPDLFISRASPHSSFVSFLLRKKHITFSDTEVSTITDKLSMPFVDTVLTPAAYKRDWQEKHIKYRGFHELSYLHPNHFSIDKAYRKHIDVGEKQKLFLVRFVAWYAGHDVGHSGLNTETKREIINLLLEHGKVLISSESELPDEFQEYKIEINPTEIHSVMASCDLFVGEGATMASECAMLGVPAIYVNSITAGTLEKQAEYGLIYSFRNSIGVTEKINELLLREDLSEIFQKRRVKMLSNNIDVTEFMLWFIDKWPKSKQIMLYNPYYQDRFR